MDFHARRFDRAAGSYGGSSMIQDRMAERLVSLVPPGEGPPAGAGRPGILEMGCGTGNLTRRLLRRFPGLPLLATDAAPRMIEETEASLGGEGRLATATFDARGPRAGVPAEVRGAAPYLWTASNALVQWFPGLEDHFSLVSGLLAPGGRYLVSGFLRDNFPELNSLLAEEPFNYREFPGHGRDEVEEAAGRAGLSVETLAAGMEVATYPGLPAFLDHIRNLGAARRPEPGRSMTRGRLALLAERYQARHGGTGPEGAWIRATWMPWYAVLAKPA